MPRHLSNNEELFAREARLYLGVEQDDYYFDEYESGLDHLDLDSISELARHFFLAGQKSKTTEST